MTLSYWRLAFASAAIVVPLATSAFAQMSLDEIEASVGGMSDEMARVDALLAEPDQNKRLAAMKMLIQSGNPLYESRARETGLFSSEKEMQRVALAAIFDGGGPFRADFSLSGVDEDEAKIRSWIKYVGGTLFEDGKMGQVTIYTSAYDEERKCWPLKSNENHCAFTPTGDYYVLDWDMSFRGTLALTTEAVLAGEGAYDGLGTVKLQINLVE